MPDLRHFITLRVTPRFAADDMRDFRSSAYFDAVTTPYAAAGAPRVRAASAARVFYIILPLPTLLPPATRPSRARHFHDISRPRLFQHTSSRLTSRERGVRGR